MSGEKVLVTAALVGLAGVVMVCAGGCIFEAELVSAQAEAMRAEIQALAADKSSTQDSDCGWTGLSDLDGCSSELVVYSRATVDEERLLNKVRYYNDFVALTSAGWGGRICLLNIEAVVPRILVSENGQCVAKVLSQETMNPRMTDLVYGYSGGFAGIGHSVRITPDEQVYVTDNHGPETLLGALPYAKSWQLNALLLDWSTLPAVNEEPVCCDGFGHAITYQGRTLSWSDGQQNVPARLAEIAGLVISIEQGLGSAP